MVDVAPIPRADSASIFDLSITSHGILGLFTALSSTMSWFLLESKMAKCNDRYEELSPYHIITMVLGYALFFASLFKFRVTLYEASELLHNVFGLAMMALGAAGMYVAYLEFHRPCIRIPTHPNATKTVIDWGDDKLLTVFLVDVITVMLTLATGISFIMGM